MNDLEKEFIASLKSLLVRYGVKIKKELSGLDDDYEMIIIFYNSVEERKNEIYLTMDEIHGHLIEKQREA